MFKKFVLKTTFIFTELVHRCISLYLKDNIVDKVELVFVIEGLTRCCQHFTNINRKNLSSTSILEKVPKFLKIAFTADNISQNSQLSHALLSLLYTLCQTVSMISLFYFISM